MKTILCYGDSNTYGFDPRTGIRYPKEVRWPGRLGILLGEGVEILEEGCNGRTTVFEDPVEGWKRGLDYLKPCLNTHKPVDVVVLMLGTNDLKKTFGAGPKESAEGIRQILQVIYEFTKEKQGFIPKVLLVSPPPIGEYITLTPFRRSFDKTAHAKSLEFGTYYREAAEDFGCLFLNAAEYLGPSEDDCLHLSPEGHRILAEKISVILHEQCLE